jgi:hypothetical protein
VPAGWHGPALRTYHVIMAKQVNWPAPAGADGFPQIETDEHYQLDVYLVDDRPVDVRVDGESVFPTWFKVEFKENGEISAKVKGLKLSSKRGDTIRIHLGPP